VARTSYSSCSPKLRLSVLLRRRSTAAGALCYPSFASIPEEPCSPCRGRLVIKGSPNGSASISVICLAQVNSCVHRHLSMNAGLPEWRRHHGGHHRLTGHVTLLYAILRSWLAVTISLDVAHRMSWTSREDGRNDASDSPLYGESKTSLWPAMDSPDKVCYCLAARIC
jgi:hypothetical protein